MELKSGDKITFHSRPPQWSAKFSNIYPLDDVNFPITMTVKNIEYKDNYYTFDAIENIYGWCLKEHFDFSINSKTVKDMQIFKTKEILNRKVTVCVNVSDNKLITAGYSVTHPDDEFNNEISKKISIGRALKDKSNILEPMFLGEGMDKKYILYAIADKLLKDIEFRNIQIKGIK